MTQSTVQQRVLKTKKRHKLRSLTICQIVSENLYEVRKDSLPREVEIADELCLNCNSMRMAATEG